MRTSEPKFTRGAWALLLFVIFLFLWGAALMLYLYTLPTDGWFATPAAELETSIVYRQNMLGAPSQLQPGDRLIAIEGIGLEEEDLSALQERWRVGEMIRYTVVRDGAEMEVSVPLVTWQIGPAIRYWVLEGSGFGMIGMLIFLAAAALAFVKRPNDHAARTLFLFAALFPALSSPIQSSQTNPTTTVFPILAISLVVTTFVAYSVLYPPALLELAMVFPHPKPIIQRHPLLEYLPYLAGLGVVPLFLLQVYIAGYIWTVFSIVGAIVLLIHSAFTMRDALSRAQLLWGLWGFVLGLVMFLANYLVTFGVVGGVWADVAEALASFSFSVMGVTLTIAILRYRLFDIGIIVRRTLTYALVGALLLIIYFGSVILLQQLFAGVTGQRSEVITVLSTLGIAALFVPLRNRIQTEVDKRFNRKKYDAQKVLNDFATTVRDETDLEKLTGRLIQVVDETMEPRSVSVWLKRTANDKGRGHAA